AYLRLLEVKNLLVDEAVLTGESVAVDKDSAPVVQDAVLGDRASMAFSGTLVTRGRASGVVVSRGADTEIGKISAMLREVETLTTPLLRQIARFGRWLSAVIVLVAGGTFARRPPPRRRRRPRSSTFTTTTTTTSTTTSLDGVHPPLAGELHRGATCGRYTTALIAPR